MKKFAWVIAVLSIASAGCDKLGPVFGLVGEPAKPMITGTIRGKIVDRDNQPIAGAKVSNGAAVFYSASDPSTDPIVIKDDLWRSTMSAEDKAKHQITLEKGEFVLAKVAANTVTSIMAEFDGQYSSAVQTFVDANTFDNTSETETFTRIKNPITLPIYGPVDSAHLNAVEYVSNSIGSGALEGTSAASPSTAVNFAGNGLVSLYLKAPPGSLGATVKYYRVTYYPLEADLSNLAAATPISTEIGEGIPVNPIERTLALPALIQAATNTRSGPLGRVDLTLVAPEASMSAYVRAKSELKAYVELLDSSRNAIMSRDATISTTVTIRFKE
ncbi:MAG TPA: hypothetical protein V6D00_04520 [Pantanalinema sp.]